MTILALIFGAIGVGYGITTLNRKYIEIYSIRKREIVEYKGQSAQIVSFGILTASLALLAIGLIGPQAWVLVLLGAILYYGSLYIANRMN
jgi:hypothetical protein